MNVVMSSVYVYLIVTSSASGILPLNDRSDHSRCSVLFEQKEVFGTALENMKNKIINDPTLIQQKSNPITSSQVKTTASNDNQTNTPPDHELIIITDSILSEIDQYFHHEDKRRVSVIKYSGQTICEIADQIDTALMDKKPTTIAIHCSTNSLDREDLSDIKQIL